MAKSKQHENKMDRYDDITTAIIRRKNEDTSSKPGDLLTFKFWIMLKISLLDGASRKIDDLFLCFKKFIKLGDLLGRELAKIFCNISKEVIKFFWNCFYIIDSFIANR